MLDDTTGNFSADELDFEESGFEESDRARNAASVQDSDCPPLVDFDLEVTVPFDDQGS